MKSTDKFDVSIFPLVADALDMLIATIPLAALLVVMFIGSTIDQNFGLNVGLADNMFWYFGHPIVYQLLFPAVQACISFSNHTLIESGWAMQRRGGHMGPSCTNQSTGMGGSSLIPIPVSAAAGELPCPTLHNGHLNSIRGIHLFLLSMTWKGGIKWDPPMLFTYMGGIFAWLEGGDSAE